MTNEKPKLVDVTSSPEKEKKEISDELISARAFERWQQRGCPLWENEQDWFAARAELESERSVGTESPASSRVA